MKLSNDQMAYMPMHTILRVEYVAASNFAAVPVNCQLRTSLPLSVVLVLFAFPHAVICIIVYSRVMSVTHACTFSRPLKMCSTCRHGILLINLFI